MAAPWSFPAKPLVRFFAVYFGIYVFGTQMLEGLIVLPIGDVPELGTIGPFRWMVEWAASVLFGIPLPLVVTGSGSGDKTYDWVQALCFLILAAVITAIWGGVSRSRPDPTAWFKWFRLFLRFALGSTFIQYGAAKAIPLQMPFPSLTRLLEPYGQFSPMGVLWASIGASRPYEIFTGCAELSAGILLFIPQTATLGALVALGCAIQIFTLNMTYDVPVKLFSFHLLLMSVFLLAPDVRRLLDVVVLNRPAGISPVPPLEKTERARRISTGLQILFGAYLVGMNIRGSMQAWTQYGGGAPKSVLYGIWNVAFMSVDGVERPALVTVDDRWRRVVFDAPTRVGFQRMDDTMVSFGAKIEPGAKSLALTKGGDPKWTATFAFERPSPDRLTLGGAMDGKKIEMRLDLFPREKFLLVTRGFNWIQEYPFNR